MFVCVVIKWIMHLRGLVCAFFQRRYRNPSCSNSVLLKATGLHSCMLLSLSQDMFLKHGLSDPPALWCVEEQEQPSRRQFYFNCYLPFLPVLHFPLPLEQINRKNVKGLTGKQLRFKLNSLQSVFTSLTWHPSSSPHMAEEKARRAAATLKLERERGGDRPFEYVFSVYH